MSFFRMNTLIPLTDGTTTPQQIHGEITKGGYFGCNRMDEYMYKIYLLPILYNTIIIREIMKDMNLNEQISSFSKMNQFLFMIAKYFKCENIKESNLEAVIRMGEMGIN